MRTGDTSRPVKFDPGTLVMHTDRKNWGVGVVDKNTGGYDDPKCWVRWADTSGLLPFAEDELRLLTFGEFLLYKDPVTNGLKIGKNKAVPLLIANGMALLFICCTFTIEGAWKFGPLIVGLGIIGVTLLGTWRNYTGKQA